MSVIIKSEQILPGIIALSLLSVFGPLHTLIPVSHRFFSLTNKTSPDPFCEVFVYRMGLALLHLLALLEFCDHALDIDDHGLRGLFRQRLQTPLRVAQSSEFFEGALPCVRLVQS